VSLWKVRNETVRYVYISQKKAPDNKGEAPEGKKLTLDGNPDKSGSALTRDTGDAVDDRHIN